MVHVVGLLPRSLTPQGDIALSLLQAVPKEVPLLQQAAPPRVYQPAAVAAAAVPMLLPAAPAPAGSGSGRDDAGGSEAAAPVALGGSSQPILPYVRDVPRAVVAAVAAGQIQ